MRPTNGLPLSPCMACIVHGLRFQKIRLSFISAFPRWGVSGLIASKGFPPTPYTHVFPHPLPTNARKMEKTPATTGITTQTADANARIIKPSKHAIRPFPAWSSPPFHCISLSCKASVKPHAKKVCWNNQHFTLPFLLTIRLHIPPSTHQTHLRCLKWQNDTHIRGGQIVGPKKKPTFASKKFHTK